MLKFLSNPAGFLASFLPYFWSPQLKAIDIELTNRCNLRCKMCWFHGEGGIGDRYVGAELTSDEVSRLLTQLSPYKPRIYLGGSEPFVRKDALSILEEIKYLGLSVLFTTNGTLFDQDKIMKLVKFGIDHIIFSIDGYEELHDEIRGRGLFKIVTSNIRELSQFRKEAKCNKPVVSVNITITPSIIGHLQETVKSIREATQDNVDVYRIHQLWFITPQELSIHQSITKKFLDCSAPKAACHLTSLSRDIDPLVLWNEMIQLKKIKKIKFFPNLDCQGLVHYHSECSPAKYRCFAPFYRTLIKPNGDVKFCPDEWIDDYILGNIRNDMFKDIWGNQKARYFRSVILRRKSFPACKRCSSMYSFRQ
jgi:radical SAM protein with 4Fe4S-binding SPASM domain